MHSCEREHPDQGEPHDVDFIRIDREIAATDLWLSEKFTRAQAWLDLQLLARTRPGSVRVRGIKVELQARQLAKSVGSLAARWRWSPGKAKRFMDELKIDGRIAVQTGNQTTIITILEDDGHHPVPNSPPANSGQWNNPWERLDSRLAALGCVTAHDTIYIAKRNGCSPDLIHDFIDFWENHRPVSILMLERVIRSIDKNDRPESPASWEKNNG